MFDAPIAKAPGLARLHAVAQRRTSGLLNQCILTLGLSCLGLTSSAFAASAASDALAAQGALSFESRTAIPEPGHAHNEQAVERSLRRADRNRQRLGLIPAARTASDTGPLQLLWPLREAVNFTGASVQAISGYMDQNRFGGMTRDWNCAEGDAARTYDGHRGVDIYLSPFSWYQMEQDSGIVVAAAPGVILDKVNDQPERSCDINGSGGDNNRILIEHADGSRAIYAHMRTGSLTAKAVGDRVDAGDYLGVVGSAGNSTGPHLHFEIGYLQNGWNAIDPFKGACGDNDERLEWLDQPAYFEPQILSVASHSRPPSVPSCPQVERPWFADSFASGNTLQLSAALRDLRLGDRLDLEVQRPDGSVFSSSSFTEETQAHYSAAFVRFTLRLPAPAQAGAWRYRFTYTGESRVDTREGTFRVNSPEPEAPVLSADNNVWNGLWYDPARDGEGFNIVTSAAGSVVYYYGSTASGERLWLISELLTGPFSDSEPVSLTLYESTGGTFGQPIASSRGLSHWGTLELDFERCDAGVARLAGQDGEKVSDIIKLVAVPGTGCSGAVARPASSYAGLWYDPALEGEGFNLVVTPVGTVLYYYGFDALGERLWLLTAPFQFEYAPGSSVEVDLLRAPGGTFDEPQAPPLSPWGQLAIEYRSCEALDISMQTPDGLKDMRTERLVSVVGFSCEAD